MDENAKRSALRLFGYGVYVLGAKDGGEIDAATVNWAMQTSFRPPLVVAGVKKDGRPFALLHRSRHFTLSFLESGQRDLAFAFFKPTRVDGSRLNGFPFEEAPESGAPVLSDALGWIEAKVRHIDDSGDHAVVIGEVTDAAVRRTGKPLSLAELGLTYGG